MPEAHSKYSASKSKIWLACAGALPLSAGIPNRSSKYSREGTAAHTVASWALEEGKPAAAYVGRRVPVEHETFEVDRDMAEHLQVYIDLVTGLRDMLDATLLVEQKLDYGAILTGTEEEGQDVAWGTGDAVLIAGDELIAIDLKFGRGEEVDATENSQLMLYALGALQAFGDYADFKTVRVIISQPRISKAPSEWSCSVEDLIAFRDRCTAAVIQVERAEDTFGSRDDLWDAAYLAAGDHCRWCPAKATCPEYRGAVADTVFGFIPATAEEFASSEDDTLIEAKEAESGLGAPIEDWLAAAMAKTDFIEHWIKAVRAEVEARLLAGTPVKGYKVVQGKQGNRAWSDAAEAEKLMRDTFRLKSDDMYDKTVISPTSAEKLAKAETIGKRQWPKLAALITRSEGKLSVAPETDKRPAVDVKPVADEFAAEPDGSEYA